MESEVEFEGILETLDRDSYGFVREFSPSLKRQSADPFVSGSVIKRHNLRAGVFLTGLAAQESRKSRKAMRIYSVNGFHPSDWAYFPDIRSMTVIQPEERIRLETGPDNLTMRIMDLICPIGKGQRAMIVSPPKAGKTTILQDICHAVAENHPEIDVIVLLVDERPEEVTDMLRSVEGDVFASSNDQAHTNHLRIAQLGMQIARRRVETGKDVMVLIDSITRIGRACNLGQPSSGKTMSGGIDARALEIPRRLFGAARNLENGGSLTVIGTALINTNSRMDDFIYEEFKGTGNSELVLDRDLADRFIFPAVDVVKSGTRKTELLVGDDLPQLHLLRRYLMRLSSTQEAMEALLEGIGKTKTNAELLQSIKENGANQ